MKKSRFTEEQIAYALRLADSGTPVVDVCRQIGVSEATYENAYLKKHACRPPSHHQVGLAADAGSIHAWKAGHRPVPKG